MTGKFYSCWLGCWFVQDNQLSSSDHKLGLNELLIKLSDYVIIYTASRAYAIQNTALGCINELHCLHSTQWLVTPDWLHYYTIRLIHSQFQLKQVIVTTAAVARSQHCWLTTQWLEYDSPPHPSGFFDIFVWPSRLSSTKPGMFILGATSRQNNNLQL